MTVYAPSDVQSVTVPHGCGTTHTRPDELHDDERFGIDCEQCEPLILAQRHGWANNPLHVEMTPDERAAYEALDAKAKAQQAMTWSDPNAIGEAVAKALGAQAAPPGNLLAQIRALSDDDKQALAGLLRLDVAPPASADDALTKPPKKATGAKASTPPAPAG